MPTKVRESLVLEVGALVETRSRVCALPQARHAPGVHPVPNILNDQIIVESGEVGIILQRPQTSYPDQFLVQFVGNKTYWMYGNEIVPYGGLLAKF
jgi:hypothetical protein